MNRFVFLVLSSFLPIAAFGQVAAPPRPESSTTRPRMADSATGYIDNAIVGSQVRFRFDSGFNIDTPDRAEFFYAKCGCYRFVPSNNPAFDPDAPGPGGFGQIEDSMDYQELHMELEYLIAN